MLTGHRKSEHDRHAELKCDVVQDTDVCFQLILQIKHITVKLEGGVGKRTVPLIITEMNLHSEVKDWSTKLFVSAELALEVVTIK